jgi:adenylosuccinate synthase
VAHRYAIEVCGGVDGIALTHLDIVGPALKFCDSYDWTDRLLPGPVGDLARQEALTRRLFSTRPRYSNGPVDWPSAVSTALDAPVVITSHGPTVEGKQVLRPNWAARAHPATTGGHPAR